jgi:3-oxoacyl-[acyl-carrier-protein] synthase III
MTNIERVGIAGTGLSVPDRVMSNDDFAKVVDTNDEWITQRTGIKERRWLSDGENGSDLAFKSAQQAMENAGVTADQIDLIVVGTISADMRFPANACLIQARLEAKNAAAFDVSAACTGFLTALHTAEAFVASGRAKVVLAIGVEALSRMVNMEDRGSCILFGDGAGAAILRPWSECEQGEILKSRLGADGEGCDFIAAPMGGTANWHTAPSYVAEEDFIQLKGREVYRFAVTKMTKMIKWAMEGHDPDDVCLLVPHQVNMRIIEASLDRLDWSVDRCMINIERYGNTSAASVPIALHEAVEAGRMQKGKLVILVAFGAGLTWGATLLRW